MSNLTVYWDQRIVGTISRHQKGKITFQYAAEWLESRGRQISLSLPCRELAEEYLPTDIAEVKQKLTAVLPFNYLIGNNDAHGKNFAIIHDDTIKLAPFYDLVSTQVYPSLDRKLAMAIGNTFRHDRVNENAFTHFSKDMKLRPEKAFEIIAQTALEVERLYEGVLSIHEKQYGKAKIYADLHTVLRRNLKRLEEIAHQAR